METKDYIAQKIRDFREARNWKQSELGAALTPPKGSGTVSSWENGRTTPDADTLINLCQVFNVDISDFYPQQPKRGNSTPDLSPDEQDLVDLYRGTADFGRRAVMSLAHEYREHMPRDADYSRYLTIYADMTDEEVEAELKRYRKAAGIEGEGDD